MGWDVGAGEKISRRESWLGTVVLIWQAGMWARMWARMRASVCVLLAGRRTDAVRREEGGTKQWRIAEHFWETMEAALRPTKGAPAAVVLKSRDHSRWGAAVECLSRCVGAECGAQPRAEQ